MSWSKTGTSALLELPDKDYSIKGLGVNNAMVEMLVPLNQGER